MTRGFRLAKVAVAVFALTTVFSVTTLAGASRTGGRASAATSMAKLLGALPADPATYAQVKASRSKPRPAPGTSPLSGGTAPTLPTVGPTWQGVDENEVGLRIETEYRVAHGFS